MYAVDQQCYQLTSAGAAYTWPHILLLYTCLWVKHWSITEAHRTCKSTRWPPDTAAPRSCPGPTMPFLGICPKILGFGHQHWDLVICTVYLGIWQKLISICLLMLSIAFSSDDKKFEMDLPRVRLRAFKHIEVSYIRTELAVFLAGIIFPRSQD